MRFKVGDVIHNKTTQEEGRIVRIANLAEDAVGYIVSVVLSPRWGDLEKEILWRESEVTNAGLGPDRP
jgi:hypothetical protein